MGRTIGHAVELRNNPLPKIAMTAFRQRRHKNRWAARLHNEALGGWSKAFPLHMFRQHALNDLNALNVCNV